MVFKELHFCLAVKVITGQKTQLPCFKMLLFSTCDSTAAAAAAVAVAVAATVAAATNVLPNINRITLHKRKDTNIEQNIAITFLLIIHTLNKTTEEKLQRKNCLSETKSLNTPLVEHCNMSWEEIY